LPLSQNSANNRPACLSQTDAIEAGGFDMATCKTGFGTLLPFSFSLEKKLTG